MQFFAYNSDDTDDDDDGKIKCARVDDEIASADNNCYPDNEEPSTEVEADCIALDGTSGRPEVRRIVNLPTKWSAHNDSDDESGDDRSNNFVNQQINTDSSIDRSAATVMSAMDLLSSVTSTPKFLSSYHTEKAFVVPAVSHNNTATMLLTKVNAPTKQQLSISMGELGGRVMANSMLKSKHKEGTYLPSVTSNNKDSKETVKVI